MGIIKEITEYYLLPSLMMFKAELNRPQRYKLVTITQKNGKERTIYVPNTYVKMAQSFVLNNYLEELNCSRHAIAYTRGKSIIDGVFPHSNNKYFLHLDIKHFFDNIRWGIFVRIVMDNFPDSKLAICFKNHEEVESFKTILTFREYFVQGSVTSPYISNIYLKEFDNCVTRYLSDKLKDCVYTRYSDDIIISSSSKISWDTVDYIASVLRKYNLRINYNKVSLKKLTDSVRFLGLTLRKDKKICLSTNFKKELKNDIYKAINGRELNFNKLFGKIYYLMMADPEYFNRLQVKYREKKRNLLMLDRLKQIEEDYLEIKLV